MKAQLIVIFCFSAIACTGQQLQILRPDSSVFATASRYDYVALRTYSGVYIAGQLIDLTSDTLTIVDRRQTEQVAMNQVTALKKTSKFGITAKRLSVYSAVVPILFLPNANSSVYEGRSWANRFIMRAAVILPVGMGLGFLLNGRALRKAEKGYSFTIVR